MQEIREWFDGPLALSGAIANGGAVLAAQAMGADLAYIGSAFIATREARALEAYKQAIVDGTAEDIVGSSLFTGIFGNYLRPSIVKAGLDPDNLPKGDAKTMNFGSGGGSDAKVWRDIWGSGQGIGAVKAVTPVSRTRRAPRQGIRGGEGAHLRVGVRRARRGPAASAREGLCGAVGPFRLLQMGGKRSWKDRHAEVSFAPTIAVPGSDGASRNRT